MTAATASAEVALRFDEVRVELGRREVLRGASFALARGEIAGVLGRNGAGKTTLLRTAARALTPSAGRVELFGAPIEAVTRRAIARRVAVVPQDLHVPFPFLVSELVLMGRVPHQPLLGFESARDVERAAAALARLGIESLADRPIDALSGGERQLVLLARALVQEPDLLLLDEPTAFLDLHHRALVLRIVRELVAERGMSALVVSHDVSLAARACDRLLLLHEGRVALAGRARDVLDAASLARVFGLDALVIEGPDGEPLVVPRIA